MRDISAKLYVLRENVPYTELELVSSPTIRASADGEIKTSLSAEVVPNDEINWLTDELKPVLVIDGIEYSYGIFSPTTYAFKNDGIESTISIEAYDRCWMLKVKKADRILHFEQGENYITTILGLLVDCGIALVNSTPTDLTLATAREDWDIGTDYLTIVNTLLDEISYNPIWFNAEGFAVIEPKQQLNGTIARHYNYRNIKTLCSGFNATMDFFNAPNVFLCVCSNPDHSVWTATAKNDNPVSPLSIPRRGREIIEYVKVDNIASQNELENYAANLAFQRMLIYQTVEITTGLIVGMGINEVVSIVHPNYHGIAREVEWTITLEPNGEMTHVLEATSLTVADKVDDEEPTPVPPTPPDGTIAGIAIAGINIVGVA